jgi:hypothetical protein
MPDVILVVVLDLHQAFLPVMVPVDHFLCLAVEVAPLLDLESCRERTDSPVILLLLLLLLRWCLMRTAHALLASVPHVQQLDYSLGRLLHDGIGYYARLVL